MGTPINAHRSDLEYAKFVKVGDDIAVRTTAMIDPGASIDAVPSGFKVAQKNTTVSVSDVAIKLPGVSLTGRNQISIQNLSSTDTLYIGNSDVTADQVVGTTSGWPVGPNESLNELVQDDVQYWGVTKAGKTILVMIRELA